MDMLKAKWMRAFGFLGKACFAAVFILMTVIFSVVANGALESVEAAAGDTLIHNSLNSTSTTTRWQSQGGWGVPGGKYGEFTCDTCHVRNMTNIKQIRSTITTPDPSKGLLPGDGQTIIFDRTKGNPGDPGTFGDDSNTPRTTSNKICEVCHTYDAARVNGVNVHAYNSQGANLGNHQNANAQDCIICHKHNEAFKPLTCNACHGNPPTANTPGGPDGLALWDGKTTGSSTAGRHATHATALGYSCDTCHNNSVMPEVSTAKPGFLDISIAFSTFGVTTGSYSGQAGVSYNNALGTGGLTCSTVYCHGSSLDGLNKTPTWAGSVACGDCHKATAANPPSLGSHARHAGSGAGQLSLACSDCHGANGAGGAGHVTGNIEWNLNTGNSKFGSGAKYNAAASGAINNVAPSAGYQTCSTVYCHSNVQSQTGSGAPTVYATPQWGGGSLNCGSCHKDMANDATASGIHKKHAQDNGYSCGICHNGAGANTIKHADTRIDVAFGSLNPSATYSQTTNTPGNGYGTCSTTYCHGSGAVPAWGGGPLFCNACHGAGNIGDLSASATAGHAIHYNTATLPTSLGQADDFTNGYAYGCSNCHPTNQHAKGQASANSAADIGGTKLSAGQYTAGGTSSTDAKGFKYTAGTCATNNCHTDGRGGAVKVAVTWSSAKTGDCGVCHNKAGDASPTWSAPHTKHINTYSANANLTCNACHSVTAASNTAINNTQTARAQHPNGVKNVDLGVFSGGSYTTGAGCSATYCHSQGTTFTGPFTQLTATQAWSGTTACDSCHTGGIVSGPSYTNGSPKANSHNRHVVVKGYACVNCHAATVNTSNAIINTSKHVNKTHDILGSGTTITYTYAADGGTCATACHYTSTPKWGMASSGCNFCHAALPTSGAHAVHVANAATSYGSTAVGNTQTAYDFGCGNCHLVNNPNHGNGAVVVSLLPSDGGTLKSRNSATASYDSVNRTCTGVYCHSNGSTASIAAATTPSWGQTFAGMGGDPCAKCHANSPTGTSAHAAHVVGIHYNNVYTGATGLATAGSGSANAHGNATTSTTISCNLCHYNTVQKARNKNNAVCATCHSGDAASTALTRADLDKRHHIVSGTPEVSFAPGNFLSKAQLRDDITTVAELNGSWTRTNGYKTANSTDVSKGTPTYNGGTCSTVACHNGHSVSWTATNISCKSCHTVLPQ
jgi:predicted CxxxxCH...CXXCH cytochrome family protein